MARLRKVRAALRASATHTPSPGLHAPARWHVPTADTIDAHSNESTRSASETQPVAELASATVGPARTCAGVEPRRRQARLIRIGMLVLAASAHAMLHEWNGSMKHDTSLRSRALGLFLLSTRPMSCRISLTNPYNIVQVKSYGKIIAERC